MTLLPHQMVLEDSFTVKPSSLGFLVSPVIRVILMKSRWFKNVFSERWCDLLPIMSFISNLFRRTWAKGLFPQTYQSVALTSRCLSLSLHLFLVVIVYNRYFYLKTELILLFSPLSVVSQGMLDVFEAIQGKFRQIRSLTQRQKDHLKRFRGGNDTVNGKVNI